MTESQILLDTSIKLSNYLSLGPEPVGFESIYPINVIIGRNNSGKSALIDMVEMLFNGTPREKTLPTPADQRKHELTHKISDKALSDTFGSQMHLVNAFKGRKVAISRYPSGQINFLRITPPHETMSKEKSDELGTVLYPRCIISWDHYDFCRITSERDIVPEIVSGQTHFSFKGNGFTNYIRRFIQEAALPTETINGKFLDDLNTIVGPDMKFEKILVERFEDNNWEILLREPGKKKVRLSDCGSGLKTIFLILGNMILKPILISKPLHKFIYAFEEIETNLHPALLRRVLNYIGDFASRHHSTFFLSTHSSVLIDHFSKMKDAQILHVTKDSDFSKIELAQTYISHSGILDDLDVRASDLLQANAIIWVEGPSDRVYLNKWIELASGGLLRGGLHYQCMFYGGRLLSHLTADENQVSALEAINLMLLNRHCVVLMDSDKTQPDSVITETKSRIFSEAQKVGAIPWITCGREVENYIPKAALQVVCQIKGDKDLERYEDIGGFLSSSASRWAKKFEKNKVEFSQEISSILTKEDAFSRYDLLKHVTEIIKAIRRWNGMSDCTKTVIT